MAYDQTTLLTATFLTDKSDHVVNKSQWLSTYKSSIIWPQTSLSPLFPASDTLYFRHTKELTFLQTPSSSPLATPIAVPLKIPLPPPRQTIQDLFLASSPLGNLPQKSLYKDSFLSSAL